jgi:hypothetical protein
MLVGWRCVFLATKSSVRFRQCVEKKVVIHRVAAAWNRRYSMIPKSGLRFSEKIMLKQEG